jgi:hypothetical protein
MQFHLCHLSDFLGETNSSLSLPCWLLFSRFYSPIITGNLINVRTRVYLLIRLKRRIMIYTKQQNRHKNNDTISLKAKYRFALHEYQTNGFSSQLNIEIF